MAIGNHLGGDDLAEKATAMGIDATEMLIKSLLLASGKLSKLGVKGAVTCVVQVGKTGAKCLTYAKQHGGVGLKKLREGDAALSHVDLPTDKDLATFCKTFKHYKIPYNIELIKDEGLYRVTYHAKQADIAELALKECNKNSVRNNNDISDNKSFVVANEKEMNIIRDVADKYNVALDVTENKDSGTYTIAFSADKADTLEVALNECVQRLEAEKQKEKEVENQVKNTDEKVDADKGSHEKKPSNEESEKFNKEEGQGQEEVSNTDNKSISSPQEQKAKSDHEHIKDTSDKSSSKTEKDTSLKEKKDNTVPERASDHRKMKDRLDAAEKIAQKKNAERNVRVKEKNIEKGDR